MSLPGPRRRLHPGDVVAGISVALILIPQALAYAEIAGLPASHGLYAAALPPLVAAFFASSPYLQTGPVAMTALLTFGGLSGLAAAGSPDYVKLAALLALVVGVIRLGMGLLHTGVVAYLMSLPVVRGFTAAAAILIAASQLPLAVGVSPPEGRLLYRAWWTLLHIGEWEPEAVGLAALTVVLVAGGRRLHAAFPGVPLAVAAGLAYSIAAAYDGPLVGTIDEGFPPLSLALPWGDLPDLVIPGLVIALVGFAEPAAIARTYAAKDRAPWSADREFVSQGVANLAAGLSAGFPVGGSFSRSAITRLTGGRTRWSGAITGLIVIGFLPFAGFLEDLPRAVLGAVVIAAVAPLMRPAPIVEVARASRPQGAVAAVTFAATLALAPRIERAVVIGIGLAVVVHLWRELRLRVDVSYRAPTLTLQPSGVLFFGSAHSLDAVLLNSLATHPEAERIVLDLGALGRIDYTGAKAVAELVDEAREAGLDVVLTGIPFHARRILGAVGHDGQDGGAGQPGRTP